eukprot:TRINITY_DN1637_c0_g1_i1.p1 TRINITY_DN1637_c0_g1~~TRINITY_DN1637_c0_g1_i1.p1  ORF type:complete len:545 (+),score=144.52 TRINITY_DN1637_c0_g1_i1:108-1637(+)
MGIVEEYIDQKDNPILKKNKINDDKEDLLYKKIDDKADEKDEEISMNDDIISEGDNDRIEMMEDENENNNPNKRNKEDLYDEEREISMKEVKKNNMDMKINSEKKKYEDNGNIDVNNIPPRDNHPNNPTTNNYDNANNNNDINNTYNHNHNHNHNEHNNHNVNINQHYFQANEFQINDGGNIFPRIRIRINQPPQQPPHQHNPPQQENNHPNNTDNLRNNNDHLNNPNIEFRMRQPSNLILIFLLKHFDFFLLFLTLMMYEYKFTLCFFLLNKLLQIFFDEVLQNTLTHTGSSTFLQKSFLLCVIFIFYHCNLIFQPSLFDWKYPFNNQVTMVTLIHYVFSYDLFLRVFSVLLKTTFSFSSIFSSTFNERKFKAFVMIDTFVDLLRYFVPITFWYSYLQTYSLGTFISCVYFLLKFNRIYLKAKSFFLMFFPLKIGKKPNENQLDNVDKCPICMEEDLNEPTLLTCGHIFCCSCIVSWAYTSPFCPLCRTPIPSVRNNRSEMEHIVYIF